MKTITTVMLALMLFTLLGCGNQDKSSEQSSESQTNVSAPKVDLHTAVVLNDLEAIRKHIEIGSDIDVFEPTRASTPLITAAALGKTEAAKILIDAGADLNYQNNDGSTSLHTAAFFCSAGIVKALIEKGVNKTLKNSTGMTALEIVELPYEDHKAAYDVIGAGLKSAGFKIDHDHLKTTRPQIAEMLK
ncbi:MAG: ankyrin repeat domain-containing protein [candidate division Zixibacteria bacterium]|nr:ankyrin repeat domain-containing protein [candidate division Zixibacteria bacterium]